MRRPLWIDSSVAGMLNGAVPLAGAAWAVVLLRRPLPRVHAVGLLIGFAGVLAISWPQLQGRGRSPSACCSWAGGSPRPPWPAPAWWSPAPG
ncbi:MAG TPA: hypothetical protein VJB61_04120 [Actinomycetota bacterium]